jgi:hypothetical protein
MRIRPIPTHRSKFAKVAQFWAQRRRPGDGHLPGVINTEGTGGERPVLAYLGQQLACIRDDPRLNFV